MHDLGTLKGTQSIGESINDHGQIVGYSDGRAFLYSDGQMYDLNKLINPSFGLLTFAFGINNRGQITGYGSINGGNHAYLLTPVPEPSTFVLSAFGLLALAWRFRKGSSLK